MHEFSERSIYFIVMRIQVQALHNTKMDLRDYIIRIKIWRLPTNLRLKKDKCSVNSSPYPSYPRYCGGKRNGRALRRLNATPILVKSWRT